MKIVRTLAIFCVILAVFALPVYASGEEDYIGELEEALPEEYRGVELYELMERVGLRGILEELLLSVSGEAGGVISFFLLLSGICAILAITELNLFQSGDGVVRSASVGVSVISALLIFSRLFPLASSVGKSITELSAFFSSVMPIFSAVLLSGGNVSSASVQSVNMGITLSLVSNFVSEFLLPLCFSLFALTLLSSLCEGGVSSVLGCVKSAFGWGLGVSTTVLIGASSLQSLIATAADSAYLKAAKYAASGMIPMVGGAVSSALGTLAGGLSYVKSTVGATSVAVLVGISISPLLSLLLYRLAVSACLSFLTFVDCKGGVRLFSAFRAAFDSLISLYVVSVLVYISQVIIFMKGGASVFG